jgi:hypothetical protein
MLLKLRRSCCIPCDALLADHSDVRFFFDSENISVQSADSCFHSHDLLLIQLVYSLIEKLGEIVFTERTLHSQIIAMGRKRNHSEMVQSLEV